MTVLAVRDLNKTFVRDAKAVTAIDDFSLEVEEGEFVGIVGPSGCGKSTFLHILGGFEKSNGGTLSLYGEPVREPGPDRGMMFQDFSLFPWLTVERNVAWPLEVQGLPAKARAEAVARRLEMVGLGAFGEHYPSELSGGMRQRVALARLLALGPRIMLMDEPFGSLDAQTRELMQEQLLAIWEQEKKTVLFVTHDIEEAVYLGTRVVVFTARPGRVKADIAIELPSPRSLELKKDPVYLDYRNRVWDLLRAEVLKSQAELETGV